MARAWQIFSDGKTEMSREVREGGEGKSGGEPAAVQTLREVWQSWRARSVWSAVALAPL
jgi:hypothetical protein